MSSRYPPADYRPPRDRSRSPPRFDRRASAANTFDSRIPPPQRLTSDAPRGPRSQFDTARVPPSTGPNPTTAPRPPFLLRNAPPLGSGDRGRPFREREDYRGAPSPRERSPARIFKDPRDYPQRDVDPGRARRGSRDAPLSASSTYSDNSPFASTSVGGGAFSGRGRGRGEPDFIRGRAGRRNIDDRDLFRRERSPPPRWGRDLSRDGREPERRDERRFERREEDRRTEWTELRDREAPDRSWRDQAPPRAEPRPSVDSPSSTTGSHAGAQAPPIDPGRLALIEGSGNDPATRRQSVPQNESQPRRNIPETPSYLNGRADATANRYNQRSSSPVLQAPPVPAFTLSFAPSGPSAAPASSAPVIRVPEPRNPPLREGVLASDPTRYEARTDTVATAPVVPRAPPQAPLAPKAQIADPPPSAPRAPRALEVEPPSGSHGRLQGVRSMESLVSANAPPFPSSYGRAGASLRNPTSGQPLSVPGPRLATHMQSTSPAQQTRDFVAPTGPRASRISPALTSVSPRIPFASPRPEAGGLQTFTYNQRTQTPPPPSGPRNRSFSVSPKVPHSIVPTAPRADRAPPSAPRGVSLVPGRAADRLGGPPNWTAPSAPRNLQWNQWKRSQPLENKTVPAKRDSAGDEKDRQPDRTSKHVSGTSTQPSSESNYPRLQDEDKMELDTDTNPPVHSAKQSFFGQPMESNEDDETMSDAAEDDVMSSSEDDDLGVEDEALFNAKYEKRKRELEAKLIDLSAREYRATTPLECIARLARISAKDLQRVNDQQEMEVDELRPTNNNHLRPPPAQTSDSDGNADILTPNLSTPKGENETRVLRRNSDDSPENTRRIRRPSPEVINLPYLTKNSQSVLKLELFPENSFREEESKSAILNALQDVASLDADTSADREHDFTERLRLWRMHCDRLDREHAEQERIERQKSMDPLPELDILAATAPNSAVEGRRVHKFSSEYEIEQVIKQSEETARIEQEKLDREARKVQADMEKEAILPDLQTEEEVRRSVYIDSNRWRDPESLPLIFSYLPPEDTFTENERQIFVAAFKETPKKWGEIASLLPGRTYKDCIHHYYANKWDSRFKDRTKGKARGGSGRGRGRGGKSALRGRGAAAMADLDRDDVAGPNISDSGRPKRAAAPTTFGEREIDARLSAAGPSPAKKPGATSNASGEPDRKKRKGEKPGRKPKTQQHLAALAAAPTASPGKPFLQVMHNKDEIARAQSLEDANLLAGLHTGHHGIMLPAEAQLAYAVHDNFAQPPLSIDEPSRSKPLGPGTASKQSASSYWSVPEQTDFAKYIAHFGTDFASIAAHMGTKTQTMIKNHYMRQVEGGNKAELETSARDADQRRKNGEDMGAPPTPTPIVKRKYDNPQPALPRNIAPHKNPNAMDLDEPPAPNRVVVGKHASPQQFPPQPRFTSSAQTTPTTAPSPLPATLTPSVQHVQPTPPSRSLQHPLGSRISFLSETIHEPRSALQQPPQSLRVAPETNTHTPSLPARGQSYQNGRNTEQGRLGMIRDLKAEQDRAFRVQQEQNQQERIGQIHRHMPIHQDSAQGSPAMHYRAAERMSPKEERVSSPPRSTFMPAGLSGLSRPQSSQPIFGLGSLGLASSLPGRSPFLPTATKREEHRPSSVPAVPLPATATPAPPLELPKRSNLMSILNSEPEPSPLPPPKREELAMIPQRMNSPAPRGMGFSQPSTAASMQDLPSTRDMFASSSMSQSPFPPRPSFHRPAETSRPPHPQGQVSSGGPTTSQSAIPDWTTQVHLRTSQADQPSPPALDRDLRSPFFSHRSSALSSLNHPMRVNPSPPPNTMMGHSRTSSSSAQPSQAPRDHLRSGLASQQPPHQAHQSAHSLQLSPYGNPPGPAFHQRPQETRNHPHHSHNSSLNAGNTLPDGHLRGISRDDHVRQEQAFAQRDREEQEWRRRQQGDVDRHATQIRNEQELLQLQQSFGRGPPQSMHAPFGSAPPFGQPRPSFDLREASLREAENIMEKEAGRRRHEAMIMDRDREAAAEYGRRHEDNGMRRTPLGGNGYGAPPRPPPPPPPPRR